METESLKYLEEMVLRLNKETTQFRALMVRIATDILDMYQPARQSLDPEGDLACLEIDAQLQQNRINMKKEEIKSRKTLPV